MLSTPSLPSFQGKGRYAPLRLDLEVAWAAAICDYAHERISQFVTHRMAYSRAMCAGDYSSCINVLDELQEALGISYWLIENRLVALQLAGGLDKQKKFANEIVGVRKRNDVLSYVTYYASERNEDNTTPFRFMGKVRRQTDVWGNKRLADHVVYRLTGEEPVGESRLASLLTYDAASLVDYYETLIVVAAQLANSQLATRVPANNIGRLYSHVGDPRLARLLALFGDTTPFNELPLDISLPANDLYLAGEFDSAHCAVDEALKNTPDSFSLMQVKALAEIELGESVSANSVGSEVVSTVRSLQSYGTEFSEAAVRAMKLALNHRHLDFAPSLAYLAYSALSNSPRYYHPGQASISFTFRAGICPGDFDYGHGAGRPHASTNIALR